MRSRASATRGSSFVSKVMAFSLFVSACLLQAHDSDVVFVNKFLVRAIREFQTVSRKKAVYCIDRTRLDFLPIQVNLGFLHAFLSVSLSVMSRLSLR